MGPDSYKRLFEVFQSAIVLPEDRRGAYLDQACGDDADLREAVEALLGQSTAGESFAMPVRAAGEIRRGEVLAGKYSIEVKIGEGGMGAVYRAHQIDLDRRVAIKVLPAGAKSNAESVTRFKREALVVARLRHPNIVKIYDFGEVAKIGAYIVMEHLEGWSLQSEMGHVGRFSPEQMLNVMRPLCKAVQAAHDAGVIHRDLKPANVFLERVGDESIVKVLDFGIAKLSQSQDSSLVTGSHAVVGTPLYMAPEQALGTTVDGRADVYGLACIAYELLTGSPPFVGTGAFEVLLKKTKEKPAPPSTLAPETSPALDATLLRGLEVLPDQRYATPQEFLVALKLALSLGPDSIWPEQTAGPEPLRSLPQFLTNFVGREEYVSRICATLGSARVVSLVGPGGIGKTRLAVEVAYRAGSTFPDGTWFVDLSATTDASAVTAMIARSIGVGEERGRTYLEGLLEFVSDRKALLVVDNCEHVIEECANLIGNLAGASRNLVIVATSREPLAVAGEETFRVPPLATTADSSPDGSDAVRLMVDRIRLARPDFTASPTQLEEAAALCRALEGIPLAIELAAARVRAMTIGEILSRMGDRLRLLGSERGGRGRHRTLRATLDWSHDLLTPDEKVLFRRCGVFAGGFAIDAASAICASDDIDEIAVIDLLSRLIDKSLVLAEGTERSPRFRLLETVREYAAEKLRDSPDERSVRVAHRSYCASLTSNAEIEFFGPGQTAWLDAIEADWDNLRAAFLWSARVDGDAPASQSMLLGLRRFCFARGRRVEAMSWLREALGMDEGTVSVGRARALVAFANMCLGNSSAEEAERWAIESLEISSRLGDPNLIALSQTIWAKLLIWRSRFDEAVPAVEKAVELCRAVGNEVETLSLLATSGILAADRGDPERALGLFQECVEAYTAKGNVASAALNLQRLAETHRRLGDRVSALRRFEEVEAMSKTTNLGVLLGGALVGIGQCSAELGDTFRGREYFRKAAAFYKDRPKGEGMIDVVECYALMLAGLEEDFDAVLASEIAGGTRAQLGFPRTPTLQREIDEAIGRCIARLDPSAVERARARARASTLEDGIALATR